MSSARAQKCAGVQKKTIAKRSQAGRSSDPVIAAQPTRGGIAPAAPLEIEAVSPPLVPGTGAVVTAVPYLSCTPMNGCVVRAPGVGPPGRWPPPRAAGAHRPPPRRHPTR